MVPRRVIQAKNALKFTRRHYYLQTFLGGYLLTPGGSPMACEVRRCITLSTTNHPKSQTLRPAAGVFKECGAMPPLGRTLKIVFMIMQSSVTCNKATRKDNPNVFKMQERWKEI